MQFISFVEQCRTEAGFNAGPNDLTSEQVAAQMEQWYGAVKGAVSVAGLSIAQIIQIAMSLASLFIKDTAVLAKIKTIVDLLLPIFQSV